MKIPDWFRFHLSTAVVLMFAAGAMLGANLTRRENPKFLDGTSTHYCFGWPHPFVENGFGYIFKGAMWDYGNLILDIVLISIGLGGLAIFLEKRIANQKTKEKQP